MARLKPISYVTEQPGELKRQLERRDREIAAAFDAAPTGPKDVTGRVAFEPDRLLRVRDGANVTLALPSSNGLSAVSSFEFVKLAPAGTVTVRPLPGESVNGGAPGVAASVTARGYHVFHADGIGGWWS